MTSMRAIRTTMRPESTNMAKTIPSLIADEHQAVKDYGAKAKEVSAPAAKVIRHIQGEEKHHARELSKLHSFKNGISALGKKR